MLFSLYVTRSDRNALTKELSVSTDLEGNIVGESSIINPSFLITGNMLYEYNYLYCPDFGRYYFIDDIVVVRTGLFRVTCSVDVLMTYRSQILNLRAIIAKQEYSLHSNRFINDGSFIADQQVYIEKKEFVKGNSGSPGFVTNGQLVLVTLGPGGVISGG